MRIPLPASSLYNGLVNLRDREAWKRKDGKKQSPYDRMLELFGSGVGNLPPVQAALRAVVNQDTAKLEEIFGVMGFRYGYWKDTKPKDGIDVSESDTRLGIVRGVLRVYREAAYKRVLSEYPELAKKEEVFQGQRRTSREDQTSNRMESLMRLGRDALPEKSLACR